MGYAEVCDKDDPRLMAIHAKERARKAKRLKTMIEKEGLESVLVRIIAGDLKFI